MKEFNEIQKWKVLCEKLSKKLLGVVLGLIGVIGVWWLLALMVDNPLFLPDPKLVYKTFLEAVKTGFLSNVWVSFMRITQGVFLSAIVSISIGLLSSQNKIVYNAASKFCKYLGFIPPTALGGILMLMFGIGEEPKVALIFFAVLVGYLPFCINQFRNVDKELLDMGKSQGMNKFNLLKRIIFPFALPEILRGLVIQYGVGWTFIVVAEMIASQTGIGHIIQVASARGNTKLGFVCLFCIIVINWLFNTVCMGILNKVFVWRYKNNPA